MPAHWLQFVPFLVLSALMAVDELHYHRQRGLPLWERIGHPIDTAAFLAPITFELMVEAGPVSSWIFFGLATLSCLLVAKDEFVHRRECKGGEQLLHAYLFMVHPITLVSAYLLWPHMAQGGKFFSFPVPGSDPGRTFLTGFLIVTALFGIYQLVYWNVYWSRSLGRK